MKKQGNEMVAASKTVTDYISPVASPNNGRQLIMVGSELGIFSVKENKIQNTSPGSAGRQSHQSAQLKCLVN